MHKNHFSPSNLTAGAISTFKIVDRDIHLWFLQLDGSESAVTACGSVLVPEETERAYRRPFEHHRREFSVAHGVLRLLLARYVDAHPTTIQFRCGSKGKPEITAPATDLRFNMSHSGGMAVYALTRKLELGVDIERLRQVNYSTQIASQFFCSQEIIELTQLPEDVRERAFLHCWTRKEAYVKALGDGLSVPLNSFCVTLRPGDPCRFVHLGHCVRTAAQWTLQDVASVPGYAAAVAYRDAPRDLRISTFASADQVLERLGFSSMG